MGRVRAAVEQLQTRLQLRRCTSVGTGVRVFGRVAVVDTGIRRLGARVTLDGSTCPIELKAEPGGELILGDDVYIDGGASVWACGRIVIGARVRIGAYCQILDSHFHIPGEDRHLRPQPTPVIVEDDVVLGPHSILLPGAQVGRGCVVHPRTVVTRRVPPHSEVRGVPATVRSLNP